MRVGFVIAVSILMCGAAAADSRFAQAITAEATYVVGNLENLETGSEGILTLQKNTITFRSGKTVCDMAYANVTLAELGPTLTHPSEVPLYKIWQLHKRLLAEKSTYQNLTLNFKKDESGEQTITFELEESAARHVFDEIQVRTGRKPRRPPEEWWGDSLWRTTRTNALWDQQITDEQREKSAGVTK